MKKISFLLITSLLFSSLLFAQYITVQQYILEHKDMAIREMKRMGIPAAITLAQGILETENGNSELVKKSNNHFGIKCKSSWSGDGYNHDDDAPGECFRVYKDADESYRDHSNFLRGSTRYSALFKLDPRDYKAWAIGLRKAGYATNPRYPDILIKNIEDNNLQQYTLLAAGEVPVYDATKYTDDPEDKTIKDISDTTGDIISPGNTRFTQQTTFTINGSKALLAVKGTSLLAIATGHNINLGRLLELNDLNKDGLLEKDQIIFLEKKQKQGDSDYYITAQNETLYDVAQKNGVWLQSICDYNKLSAYDNIYAGTKILLKPLVSSGNQLSDISNKKANAQDQEIKESPAAYLKPVMHEVQPNEGLYSISKKYGVSIANLKEWNSLPNDNLKIGQQLIISK